MWARLKRLLLGTLRRQLTVGVALLVALMMTLFIWDVTRIQKKAVLEQQTGQTLALARSVATSSAVWVASRDFSGLQEIVQGVMAYPSLRYALVTDIRGQVLAHSDPSRRGLYLSELPQGVQAQTQLMGAGLVDALSPIMIANVQIGWVRIGLGREALDAKLAQVTRNGIWYALLAVALSSLLAALAGRYLTRRLDAIQVVAQTVQAGMPHQRVSLTGGDEAAQLAREFNAMLDTLAQREASLKASGDLFRAVFENAAIGIAQLNTSGQFLQMNQAFCQIIGYSHDEVVAPGFTFQHITYADDLAADMAHVEQLLSGAADRYSMEKRYLRKDTSLVWVSLSVQLLRDEAAMPLYFIAAAQDISQRKQAEIDIQRLTAELEERVRARTQDLASANASLILARNAADAANVAKSAFLANMSHEIRTPLNAIIGLNYLLRRDGATPQQVARLDQVDSAGRHLLSIISDVLDISKIEAGRLQLDSTDFHLSCILDNVASIFAEAARSKGLQISIDSDAVPEWLRGDPIRLRQALINYVGNAIKFTDRGYIALRASLLQDSADELQVRFEVEDSGIGIAPDKVGRLFNAFEQGDESTTRKYGGTGLGLTITRRLAQLMGGEVGVNSTLGIGSTFWFTVRLQHGHGIMPTVLNRELADAENRLRSQHRGNRILLVEDNLINREVAIELLHGAGLTVDTAVDGREALDRVQTQPYDLILMDLQMPRMNGLEATRAIRKLPTWVHKPIVAMTANAFDEDRHACEEVGMSDFVAKPVDPGQLFGILLKWLPTGRSDAVPATSHQPDAVSRKGGAPPEREAASAHVLERLKDVPGLNLTYGLRMLRGQADKYLQLLAQFIESHSGDMARLGVSLAHEDYAQARLLTHTLKGAAATLGLEQLALLAGRLNKTLRASVDASGLDDVFRADMKAVKLAFTQLGVALSSSPVMATADITPIDSVSLAALLTKLDTLLGMGSADVITLCDEHAAQLQTTLGPLGETLAHQIKQLDFDAARETLRALR